MIELLRRMIKKSYVFFENKCIAKRYTIEYNINIKKKGGNRMAAKTANVLARVEPDVKEKAEAIMAQLGIPASVVINMLYKQIIMTKSIPFSLSIPAEPIARDEMNQKQFDEMMSIGLAQAKKGESISAEDVFKNLLEEVDI